MYGDILVGYWPLEQFGRGVAAFWGGQVCNKNIGSKYTTTEMGSGQPPGDAWGLSAYVHGLEVMDMGKTWRRPQDVHSNLSSDCYKVTRLSPWTASCLLTLEGRLTFSAAACRASETIRADKAFIC